MNKYTSKEKECREGCHLTEVKMRFEMFYKSFRLIFLPTIIDVFIVLEGLQFQ